MKPYLLRIIAALIALVLFVPAAWSAMKRMRNIIIVIIVMILGISIQEAKATNSYRTLYIFCSYEEAIAAWQNAPRGHGGGDGGLLYYFSSQLPHNTTWQDWIGAGFTYDEGTWVENVDMFAYAKNGLSEEKCSDWNLLSENKNSGASIASKDSPIKGDPINIATGNAYKREADLNLISPGLPMAFIRYYNSQSDFDESFGYGWTTTFSEHLTQETGKIILRQADGAHIHFIDDGNEKFISEIDKERIIETAGDGFVLTEPDGKQLTFDSNGNLTQISDRNSNTQTLNYDAGILSSVEDNFGRRIDFAYNAQGLLETITTPIGAFTYAYDGFGNLIRVDKAAGTYRTYLYTDTNDAHNLTGIVNKKGIQAGTYTYDSQDRAVTTEGAGGAEKIHVNYDYNYLRSVTDSRGSTTTYRITIRNGIARVNSAKKNGYSSYLKEFTHNDKLWIEGETDARNMTTLYTHDSRGNVLTKTEAAGTALERTTTYTYHADYSLVTSIINQSVSSPGQNTTVTLNYDPAGNLLSRTITGFSGGTQETMTTTFTYNSFGQITSTDGPRTDVNDVKAYEYYPNDPSEGLNRGMLKKITDPLGGETRFSNYNAFGKPETITDINDITTTFIYDVEGRVISTIRSGRTTNFEYDDTSNLTKIDRLGTSDIVYTYTPANRLEKIKDSLGNYILYTYDTEGNRVRQEIHDESGTLKQFADFEFDEFNRLKKTIYPGGAFEELAYDENNNMIERKDTNFHLTQYDYDFHNRLTTATQPGSVITGYDYDSHNNLTTVTDAENHGTTYVYDDLGRQVSVTSPDTGSTTYTYDAAGNLVSKTDANGITVTYTYDALNRLTEIHYPDSTQDITYSYDAGTNGMGRLTGMTDPSGTYAYSYDVFGNLVNEQKTIEGITYTTGYAYDPTGVLTRITYPDGREVSYALDNAGRVAEITTTIDSITKTIAQNINHLPFGPVAGLTYGNGTQITRTFDERYQLAALSAGDIQNLNYTIGAAGNITAITDTLDPGKNQTFAYDDLYRLTGATGIYGTTGYTYDKVGNRLTKTLNSDIDNYAYTPTSNRLSSITGENPQIFGYDANGNITTKGSKTLAYNQNNRLIQVTENSTVLGKYTYNGNGQRIKKAAGEDTIIFHYDIYGNIIGESTADGTFIKQYVYLGNERLSALTVEAATEIAVEVTTSEGRTLSGINVYAFTDSGSYTGKTAVTDESGMARFDPGEFTDGTYKFRADYLSYQFWSDNITLPGQYHTGIQIAEETATILVTQGGIAKEGVKVYLFNADGTYLGLYQTTDQNGNVSFDLPAGHEFKFRADILGSQFMSETIAVVSGGPNNHTIAGGGGTLTVTVDKGEGTPITGIHIYLFNTSGSYLGLSDITDAQGRGNFEVPSGTYKVRADYLGSQFWGQDISVTGDESTLVSVPHQDVTLTVNGDYNGDVIPLQDLNVYLFTPSQSYLSLTQATDSNGQVTFHLPQMDYKVRADYLSQQYWSPVFNWTNETVVIDESMAQITVNNIGQPLEGINVYVFSAGGIYLNITDTTDINGQVAFRLPAGDYNFRADYMDSQYFSGVSTLIAHVSNPVNISIGGGSFTLTALKGPDNPLIGANCYLFTDTGTYMNQSRVTNDQGEVGFDLADGSYKIRVDYLGYQFWTDIFTIPADTFIDFTIPHQDVTVTVTSDYNGDVIPLEDLSVYLFTAEESYLNLIQVTDNLGQVTFNLPQMDYRVRADYLSEQYWSPVFNWTDETITINEGMAEVHVDQGSTPIEGVPVYVYTSSDTYLNINGQTDQNGITSFRLPEGTYKFRGDYQSNQYWATEVLTAHQVNVVNLSTGGGSFTLSVEKESGTPLVDVPVYVFTSSGSYLGINAQTNTQGEVTFDLADGDYKFRADYFGYQFWSNDYTIPGTLSDVLAITHQDVTVTVNQVYGVDIDPLQRINVYLFTGAGAYQGINQATDANGEVTFNLPEKDYRVRADYLSQQHWSDVFSWQDVEVDINHGTAILHVTDNGQDLYDVPVYLFTAAGSYLSRLERTDSSGQVQFLLPADSYKFRVDYDGNQYWSDVISIIPHEENSIDLQLELLADLTHDPNPDRIDGVPPVYEPEKIMVASLSSIRSLLVQSVVGQTGEDQKIYYFINDHLGTPQKLLDESADVVWSTNYKPFGEADVNVNTFANQFRFPGQYYDTETGIHFNYHRYYDSRAGRYLTPDPIGLEGGINPYTYALNDPVNLIDPYGLAYLNYNSSTNILRVYNYKGQMIGGFSAGNRGANPWPNGTNYYWTHNPHIDDGGPNTSWGSYGNFMFTVEGRQYMGVHSGRANQGGPCYGTSGCIRTTDRGMEFISNIHQVDPLTHIIVEGDDTGSGPCD